MTPYIIATYLGLTSANINDLVRAEVRQRHGLSNPKEDTRWKDEAIDAFLYLRPDYKPHGHLEIKNGVTFRPNLWIHDHPIFVFVTRKVTPNQEAKAAVYTALTGYDCMFINTKGDPLDHNPATVNIDGVVELLQKQIDNEMENSAHLADQVEQTDHPILDEWLELKNKVDAAQKLLKGKEAEIKAYMSACDLKKLEGTAVTVVKSVSKGRVNTTELLNDALPNWRDVQEQYRGESTTSYRFTKVKK